MVRYSAEAAADAPPCPVTRSELQGRGAAADRVAARGSRPRRATSPRRPFHGHVCGQRAPAPFLPPLAPRPLLRQRAPRASARPPPAEGQRATSQSSDVARPRVRPRALSSTLDRVLKGKHASNTLNSVPYHRAELARLARLVGDVRIAAARRSL